MNTFFYIRDDTVDQGWNAWLANFPHFLILILRYSFFCGENQHKQKFIIQDNFSILMKQFFIQIFNKNGYFDMFHQNNNIFLLF